MKKKGRNYIVFPKRKIAFVHIPKTGSATLKDLARQEIDSDIYTKECPKGYKCFCIVRNPFSRVYSSFCHFAEREYKPNRQAWRKQLRGYFDFNQFVKHRLGNITDWHFRPMKIFIELALSDVVLLRFEDFAEAISDIFDCKIIHINKFQKHNYHQIYNNESIEIVSQLYRWDIDNLGYSF